MKHYIMLLVGLTLMFSSPVNAEDFLGVPVMPDSKTMQKTDARLEFQIQMSHDEVFAFYKNTLHDTRDIKFRNWKDATYIEDDGNLPWHSITISKGDHPKTTIVIMKDSWTWIIGTLILRYIGVFVVLLVLFLGMATSGKIISHSIKKMEAKKASA